jgi:hypothetical protein
MNKIKTAFNNFIAQFVKTFEVNKTKPSYWLQIIGSFNYWTSCWFGILRIED